MMIKINIQTMFVAVVCQLCSRWRKLAPAALIKERLMNSKTSAADVQIAFDSGHSPIGQAILKKTGALPCSINILGRVKPRAIFPALLALLVGGGEVRAQTGIVAYFAPVEEVTNAVAASYKFRVVQDTSPIITILFGWNRVYGVSNETYLLENDVYADGFAFTNQVCTTWPEIGNELYSQSSLRSDIPDYNEHGFIGSQSSSPLMFPKQTYWIDGIPNLTKMDLITQTNMNGVECSMQLSRGGLVTNLSGWNCANQLDTNITFREWDATITFAGSTYTNRFALPDANGQYFTSYEIFDFLTEFFGVTTGAYQVYIYDLQIQSEGENWWRRINQFSVYEQNAWPTNYGVRVVSDQGKNVIEISAKVDATNYFQSNAVFDLGVSLDGEAPDLIPVAISAPATALAGQTIPVVVTVTNETTFTAGAFATGFFVSGDSTVAVNDLFVGAVTNQAGLAGEGEFTFTNFVTIPTNAPAGDNYLGAIVDYTGVLVEIVTTNNTIAIPLTVLQGLPSAGATVTNTWAMPADFAFSGWLFEDFPDTRPDGSPGGATNLMAELTYSGDLSFVNGTVTNEGPCYNGSDFYPYVMLDTNNDWLIMHPDTNHGASLGFAASYTGTYQLNGAFARANDLQYAGDGVAVCIVSNLDTTNLLFTANISSSNAVDPGNLFGGTGVAPFNFSVSLLKGDIVRFVVFSGSNNDNSFDLTALMFTASQDPVPPFAVKASQSGSNVLISWPSLANETYQVLATTNFTAWSPVAQFTGTTGTNQLSWPAPKSSLFQFYRVQLLP